MAVLHRAELSPTKLELLRAWVPYQPWLGGADASSLTALGAYRFDDPDGEVGVETHLLATADGGVLQVPLTYRGAPLAGADHALVTTMTHSVLGDRWVYDGCHDPVWARTLVTAVLTGGRGADLVTATAAGPVPQDVTTHVRGSGTAARDDVPDLRAHDVAHDGATTRVSAGGLLVSLLRRPAAGTAPLALTGTWPGQDAAVLLATVEAAAADRGARPSPA